MLRPGDTIEYLKDVSSPPSQKGFKGQTKIIDRDIDIWPANFLLDGGMIRLYVPSPPLQIEEEKPKETEKAPDGPAEIPKPASVINTKVKKERRTKDNGRRKTISETNQAGNHGPEKSDSKGRAGNRGG